MSLPVVDSVRSVATHLKRVQVALLCDLREERWASMDLIADMLLSELRTRHASRVDAEEVRAPFARRFSHEGSERGRRLNADRLLARMWDYPRYVQGNVAGRYDVFHVIDHSYSQLVHALPPSRTIVTCHDLDTFRSVLEPARESRSLFFKAMTRRIMTGFRAAARVTCDSRVIRDEILRFGLLRPEQLVVVPNGVHPSCSPLVCVAGDREADALLAPHERTVPLVLHVGSTIPRKRIDVLLSVFARIRSTLPAARLIRIGGALTAQQEALLFKLGISDAVTTLPFVSREVLASVYRRAAIVLQTSSAEGFGLPVVESMACGTPVVASDIPTLREVGGDAVTYCPVGDIPAWTAAVLSLLADRDASPDSWKARTEAAVARAALFSWSKYGQKIVDLYDEVLDAHSQEH